MNSLIRHIGLLQGRWMITSVMVFTFILGGTLPLDATHIVGGQLTYKCLGNNRYLIRLVMRRDCLNANPEAVFDDPALIGIYDENGNLDRLVGEIGHRGVISIPFNGDDTLNQIFVTHCAPPGTEICVHETVYEKIVTLPIPENRDGGYILAYQRCCRNGTLANVFNPLETGATWTTFISRRALETCNSSSYFEEFPPMFICMGERIEDTVSVIDEDGDRLVFRLCEPYSGATREAPRPDPILFRPPFENVNFKTRLTNLLNSDSDSLQIDPESGFLTGTPRFVGQYLVGICVDEYRDGELISSTRMDFEYNVRDCDEIVIADFQAPTLQCDDLTVNFQNQSINSDSTYTWFFDWPDDQLTSDEFEPSYTFPDTGIYEVALIATLNGCSDTTFQTVQLAFTEIDAAFTLDVEACMANENTYTARDVSSHGTDSSADRTWTLQYGNVTETSSEKTYTFTVPVEVEFTLSLAAEDRVGCIDMADTTLISPLSDIVADFSLEYEDCLNGENIYLASDSSGTGQDSSEERTWILQYNGVTRLSADRNFTFTVPWYEEFTLSLEVFDAFGCSSMKDTTLVALPPSLDPEPQVICIGDTTTLMPFADTGDLDNITFDANPNLIGGLVTFTPTVYSSEMAIFELGFTVLTLSGCEFRDTLTVEVLPRPILSFVDTQECGGFTVNFTNMSTDATNFIWDFGDPETDDDVSMAVSPSYTYPDSGTYTVTLTSYDGCGDSISMDIYVQLFPPFDVIITSPTDTSICRQFITLEARTEPAGAEITWLDQNGNVLGTGNAIEVEPDGPTLYIASATDEFGCEKRDSVEVTGGFVEIEIMPPFPAEICLGDNIPVTITNMRPVQQLTFNWNPDGSVTDPNTATPTLTPEESTTYILTTTNNFGCVRMDTLEVTVFVPMPPAVSADPPNIILGQSSQLSLPDGYTDCMWTPADMLDDPESCTPVATPMMDTDYSVSALDANGCPVSGSVTVTVQVECAEPYVFVPNAFTPNGDGQNDVFMVMGNKLDEFTMVIYNRWGEKVFESQDANMGWDGTFEGKELPSDVFAYMVRLRCFNGEIFEKQGNVSLLR